MKHNDNTICSTPIKCKGKAKAWSHAIENVIILYHHFMLCFTRRMRFYRERRVQKNRIKV